MDWIQRVKKKDKTSQMMVSFTRIRNTIRGPGLGERIMSLIWDAQSETPVGWARVDTHWSVSFVGLEVRRNTGTGGTGLGISNIEMVNGSTMPGKTTVFLCSICSPNPCNGKFTLSPPFSNLLLPLLNQHRNTPPPSSAEPQIPTSSPESCPWFLLSCVSSLSPSGFAPSHHHWYTLKLFTCLEQWSFTLLPAPPPIILFSPSLLNFSWEWVYSHCLRFLSHSLLKRP